MSTDQFNRDDAVALCRATLQALAVSNRPTYASYDEDVKTFDPHEWVVQALFQAYSKGLAAGRRDGVMEGDDRETFNLNPAATAAWKRLNRLREKTNAAVTTPRFLEELLDRMLSLVPIANEALLMELDQARGGGVSRETFIATLLDLHRAVVDAGGWVGERTCQLREAAAKQAGREEASEERLKQSTAEALKKTVHFSMESVVTGNQEFMEVMASGLGEGALLSWLRGQVLAFSLRAHKGNGDDDPSFRAAALDRARVYNRVLLSRLAAEDLP